MRGVHFARVGLCVAYLDLTGLTAIIASDQRKPLHPGRAARVLWQHEEEDKPSPARSGPHHGACLITVSSSSMQSAGLCRGNRPASSAAKSGATGTAVSQNRLYDSLFTDRIVELDGGWQEHIHPSVYPNGLRSRGEICARMTCRVEAQDREITKAHPCVSEAQLVARHRAFAQLAAMHVLATSYGKAEMSVALAAHRRRLRQEQEDRSSCCDQPRARSTAIGPCIAAAIV